MRRRLTWGEIYRRALQRGYDHGYAAYLADRRTTRTVKSSSADDKDKRLDALRELQQESERLGLYDADPPKPAGQ